jgi:hypothetical protein
MGYQERWYRFLNGNIAGFLSNDFLAAILSVVTSFYYGTLDIWGG